MNGWKKFAAWLKKPHGIGLLLFYLFSVVVFAASLILTVLGLHGFLWELVCYILYAVSAVCFAYTIYTVVVFIPKLKAAIFRILKRHPFTNRMLEQYSFRTLMFAIISLTISLGYALLNGAIALMELSVWYGALCGYYFILCIIRGGILAYHDRKRRKDDKEAYKLHETKVYLSTGWMLMILPISLSVVIMQMVLGNNSFEHVGIMIYVSAIYAFYKIIKSVRNVVVARKTDDLTISAIRDVDLADAFVSILALQTAMLKEFATGQNVGIYHVVTGGVVCLLTFILGLYIVIRGNRRLKQQHKQLEREGGSHGGE
jgi:hypothetical protein